MTASHAILRVSMLLLVALGTALQAGCGYALAGRGSFLPSDIRTIGIPPIENRTGFVRAEQTITEKIREEFINRGRYVVVPGVEGADAVLRGEIVSIVRQPVALTNQQLASRYLFTVVLKVTFTDTRTSEVLWSDEALTFREEYELGADETSFIDQEGSSFDRLAGDVARTVVTAIMEAF